ncbi:MAG: putative Peptidase family M28 [Promethearchaeota archaeon]|nr:MAG: putative Peptidase family M28 [Candidatus Lokiarchaeota archaeon]
MPDENYIKEILEKVSFPRLSGTISERKAAQCIKKEIEHLNLLPKIQSFQFTSFYPRIYKKIAFLLLFWVILVLFVNYNTMFTIMNIFIVLLIFLPLVLITRKPEDIRLGKKYWSENVYVTLNPDRQDGLNQNMITKRLQVLFLCHIDSKSQKLSIKLRVISVKLWIYSLFIIIISLVLKYLYFSENLIFNLILSIIIGFHFIATILQLINSTHNKSPGAIDNASGISLVLDLLSYFSKPEHSLSKIDLWFVFTGSEETGTMGVRHFSENIKNYDESNVRYLNLDSIAKALDIFGPLKSKVKMDKFLSTFFEFSKELEPKFHLKRYLVAVNRSDGYYLKRLGLTGIGLGDKSSYKYIHSPQDTPDKVSAKFLADVSRVIVKFLKEFDNNLM